MTCDTLVAHIATSSGYEQRKEGGIITKYTFQTNQ